MKNWGVVITTLLFMACTGPAQAALWLPPGDAGLRSDIELLAAAGLLRGPLTTWPLTAGTLAPLDTALDSQPPAVRAAAQRIRQRLQGSAGWQPALQARASNEPTVIRTDDQATRSPVEVQAGADFNGGDFTLQLRPELLYDRDGGGARFSPDGIHGVARLGNWLPYAGWVDHWYGAGWASSLVLSNNARPFPRIGLLRDAPTPFESPWLSWLGPWQLNLSLGLLDEDARFHPHTVHGAFRFSAVPLPGLEFALTRVSTFCGQGLGCDPLDAVFDIRNSDKTTNVSNDEGMLELRYTQRLGAVAVTPYFQMMNDDTNPFWHSYTSTLVGTSMAGAWRDTASHWRLVAEYTDSRATLDAFSYGLRAQPGLAYNNFQNRDGYRFHNRTLGFSLDSDSTLFSLIASFHQPDGSRWQLAYHDAQISTGQLAAAQAINPQFRNVLTNAPVQLKQIEARWTRPLRAIAVDLALRYQSAPLRPQQDDSVAVELGLRYPR